MHNVFARAIVYGAALLRICNSDTFKSTSNSDSFAFQEYQY